MAASVSAENYSAINMSEALNGYEHHAGFMDVYVNPLDNNVRVLLPPPDTHGVSLAFIHVLRLSAGLGSNPLGLDRGWGNSGQLVQFRQVGNRVIAEVENQRYRASTQNSLEQDAVKASFARSFIWSTEIIASDSRGLLIDINDLLASDMLGLAQTMQEEGANFKLARDRSLPDTGSLLSFPDNTEIDVFLTFTSGSPGTQVRATAANPNAVTLIQHHSFVRLPDAGYTPRTADPQTGTFALGFYDYAAPLDGQIINAYAMRHRLQHQIPGDSNSPAIKPIVFYIDSGAPADIQAALMDGANWWQDAFAAAGFADGFRAEILPADVHPLDVRYNVVQWVHRQTRGWSYGGGVIDPRTGEFIKGHVILGSQRVRQDRMIFEGLAGTDKTGSGDADDPVELALARIRQLAAHEVGHALGFGHNFAASVNDRASVMDYPAPWVVADNGRLDFSKAYGVGVGAWDIHTAKWLYSEFADSQNAEHELQKLITEAQASGLRYVEDSDARSVGTAHADGAVWDNGADAVTELANVLEVRRIALQQFDRDQIQAGQSLADLRNVLTPIYLYHRYQIAAAAKSLGGVRYDYALRDTSTGVTPIPAEQQKRALDTLLQTLTVDTLKLPQQLLQQLPPIHNSYWFTVPDETLTSRTRPVFDWVAAAETAAALCFDALLSPQRLERLYQQHLLDSNMPGVVTVLDAVTAQLLHFPRDDRFATHLQLAVLGRYIDVLIEMPLETLSGGVQAQISAALTGLEMALHERAARGDAATAVRQYLAQRLLKYRERSAVPANVDVVEPVIPPGSPIGASTSFQAETCWHCE